MLEENSWIAASSAHAARVGTLCGLPGFLQAPDEKWRRSIHPASSGQLCVQIFLSHRLPLEPLAALQPSVLELCCLGV